MLDRIKNGTAFLVFAVLLWLAWFVWPGPVRAADTPLMPVDYETSTLGTDYSTMQEWVAAKVAAVDMVTAQKGQVLILPTGTYADWCEIPQSATTNSDYFIVIKAADGATVTIAPTLEAHIGNYINTYHYTFAIWADYTKIIGINVDWSGVNTVNPTYSHTPFLGHSTAAYTRLINCTAKNVNPSGGAGYPMLFFNQPGTGLINCAVSGSPYGFLFGSGTSECFTYNCTFRGPGIGYYNSGAVAISKNCLNSESGTWTGDWTKTTCLDAVPTWLTGTDFDLDPGDTTALGQGTDLTADGTFAFSYDHNNDTRPTLWSVGADDLAEAEPEPEPETPAVRYKPWALGPWGAGPWNGATTGGWR